MASRHTLYLSSLPTDVFKEIAQYLRLVELAQLWATLNRPLHALLASPRALHAITFDRTITAEMWATTHLLQRARQVRRVEILDFSVRRSLLRLSLSSSLLQCIRTMCITELATNVIINASLLPPSAPSEAIIPSSSSASTISLPSTTHTSPLLSSAANPTESASSRTIGAQPSSTAWLDLGKAFPLLHTLHIAGEFNVQDFSILPRALTSLTLISPFKPDDGLIPWQLLPATLSLLVLGIGWKLSIPSSLKELEQLEVALPYLTAFTGRIDFASLIATFNDSKSGKVVESSSEEVDFVDIRFPRSLTSLALEIRSFSGPTPRFHFPPHLVQFALIPMQRSISHWQNQPVGMRVNDSTVSISFLERLLAALPVDLDRLALLDYPISQQLANGGRLGPVGAREQYRLPNLHLLLSSLPKLLNNLFIHLVYVDQVDLGQLLASLPQLKHLALHRSPSAPFRSVKLSPRFEVSIRKVSPGLDAIAQSASRIQSLHLPSFTFERNMVDLLPKHSLTSASLLFVDVDTLCAFFEEEILTNNCELNCEDRVRYTPMKVYANTRLGQRVQNMEVAIDMCFENMRLAACLPPHLSPPLMLSIPSNSHSIRYDDTIIFPTMRHLHPAQQSDSASHSDEKVKNGCYMDEKENCRNCTPFGKARMRLEPVQMPFEELKVWVRHLFWQSRIPIPPQHFALLKRMVTVDLGTTPLIAPFRVAILPSTLNEFRSRHPFASTDVHWCYIGRNMNRWETPYWNIGKQQFLKSFGNFDLQRLSVAVSGLNAAQLTDWSLHQSEKMNQLVLAEMGAKDRKEAKTRSKRLVQDMTCNRAGDSTDRSNGDSGHFYATESEMRRGAWSPETIQLHFFPRRGDGYTSHPLVNDNIDEIAPLRKWRQLEDEKEFLGCLDVLKSTSCIVLRHFPTVEPRVVLSNNVSGVRYSECEAGTRGVRMEEEVENPVSAWSIPWHVLGTQLPLLTHLVLEIPRMRIDAERWCDALAPTLCLISLPLARTTSEMHRLKRQSLSAKEAEAEEDPRLEMRRWPVGLHTLRLPCVAIRTQKPPQSVTELTVALIEIINE